MYPKRSTVFLTEILLLLLVAQLFIAPQQYISVGRAITLMHIILFGAAWICLFILPGWRRSYLFFNDDEVGDFERVIMSIAISISLIVFSSLYLQYAGVTFAQGTLLTIVAFWIGVAMVVVYVHSLRHHAENENETD